MQNRTASRRAQAPTVADVVARYFRSQQHFGRLAVGTQRIHRNHLGRFTAAHGDMPFADVDAGLIAAHLDQYGAHVGRAGFKAIRAWCRYGMAMGLWADDPTKQ